METALAIHKEQNIINLEDYTMPVDRVVAPGAEKLSLTFRLAPEYKITKTDLPGGHREYEVITTLLHIPTGQQIAQGVGSCSTMEGKYKYRTGEGVVTEIPVPKEYWDSRDMSILKKLANAAGIEGNKFGTKKNDSGKYMISTYGEKVEHDNSADYYNTVLKMAKKRSHVDAILTATAASDIFTQDIEDMPEVIPQAAHVGKTDEAKGDSTPIKNEGNTKPLPEKEQKPVPGKPATKADINRILAWGTDNNLTDTEIKSFVDWYKLSHAEPEKITQAGALDLFANIKKYFAEFTESKKAIEPDFVISEPATELDDVPY